MACRLFICITRVGAIAIASCFYSSVAYAQPLRSNQSGAGNACNITITGPNDGESVGLDGDVSGTATIPSDKFLWVLAHRKGLVGWWPQGGGSTSISQRSWHAVVTFGGPADSGRDFEIAAVAVDSETNTRLNAWVERTNATFTYPPTAFPPTSANCGIAQVTVTRM
jgi:hypothetical protein